MDELRIDASFLTLDWPIHVDTSIRFDSIRADAIMNKLNILPRFSPSLQ